ncbi:arsenate reductase/protein-tyrosine-phosphatase family protein [Sphaerisporangium aureirubrum]|uniref:Helix-turn-helix domain-containing protein n=1 Tax=Sphaerisporangium aureirubrum TaxID=1544736 RepID=A0ABW1NN06_9ACTN
MDDDPLSLRRRAALHHAMGDPARLAIVDALLISDLAPGELGAALGLPSNLMAHHLRVLTGAGLIEKVRSQADRRGVYVRLNPGALEGLRPSKTLTASRVVFVCTRNGARSPLAAAIWSTRSPIPVTSAGTHPGPRVHPRTLIAARRHGLPLEHHAPVGVTGIVTPGDLVVAVCDNAYRELGSAPRHAHWSVPDPGPVDTDEIFDEVVSLLTDRIDRLATFTTLP